MIEGIGATLSAATGGWRASRSLRNWIRELRTTELQRSRAHELLGVHRDQSYNYRVSMTHPALQLGVPHPDDLAALTALAGTKIAAADRRHFTLVDDELNADLEQSWVLIGSPESESLSRLLFGYRVRDDGLGMLMLESPVSLTYRWLEDASEIVSFSRRALPYGATSTRPNWPLLKRTPSGVARLTPRLTRDGWLENDYLVITRIPNFLTQRALDEGRAIVSIAGTHGIGTRSIELLLTNTAVLGELLERLNGADTDFQIVIEASSIVHDRIRGSYAKTVIVRDVVDLGHTHDDWLRARNIVDERFAAWVDESRSALGRITDPRTGSITQVTY